MVKQLISKFKFRVNKRISNYVTFRQIWIDILYKWRFEDFIIFIYKSKITFFLLFNFKPLYSTRILLQKIKWFIFQNYFV